jgi:hypothetical protein
VDGVSRGRAAFQLRVIAAVWVCLCLFFVGFGVDTAWDGYDRLPHSYARLRHAGVRTTANLVRCAPGIGGGRGVGCRISLRFAGHVRTWDYPEDSRQFERLPAGAAIPVLVDPSETTTVYTVRDVEHGTNAGLSSPVLWLGIVFAGTGFAGLAWFLRLVGLRRPRRTGA